MALIAATISSLAGCIGWSAINKCVLLKIDNAEDSILAGQIFSGILTDVNPDGSAVIEFQTPFVLNESKLERVRAVPRHKGYGLDYLLWGLISVNLVAPTGQ